MPNYIAVSRAKHANLRWSGPTRFDFAARDAIVPLVAQEFPRAQLCMPIAFVAQGDGFSPVAVLGLQAGRNLFVAADGRWLDGCYIPAMYRGYPFALAAGADGQQVLVCAEDSALISETAGAAFFDAQGNPDPAVQAVLDFLAQVQQNRAVTERICSALAQYGLIQPWPISLQMEGDARRVEGLFRIDETALNALPAESLAALHQVGALPVAYCQLLSMQHLPQLGKLNAAQQASVRLQSAAAAGEPGQGFLDGSDTISFGGL